MTLLVKISTQYCSIVLKSSKKTSDSQKKKHPFLPFPLAKAHPSGGADSQGPQLPNCQVQKRGGGRKALGHFGGRQVSEDRGRLALVHHGEGLSLLLFQSKHAQCTLKAADLTCKPKLQPAQWF